MAGQVDAAAEGKLIVHDDDLLMVRTADGMTIVEAEMDAAMSAPPQAPSGPRVALERVERRVVPDQDVAMQAWLLAGDEPEQLVESRRFRLRLRLRRDFVRTRRGQQIHAREDVPAEDEHRAASAEQRLPDQPEIVGAVLHAVELVGALDAPAVLPRLDDGIRGCVSADPTRDSLHAGLVRRRARLISQARVSGTLTNSSAPIILAADGSCSIIVN